MWKQDPDSKTEKKNEGFWEAMLLEAFEYHLQKQYNWWGGS